MTVVEIEQAILEARTPSVNPLDGSAAVLTRPGPLSTAVPAQQVVQPTVNDGNPVPELDELQPAVLANPLDSAV